MQKQNIEPNLIDSIDPHIKKASKFLTKLVEATGVSSGYSTTVAWFTERVLIASFALAVLSFAAGTMFVLRLSEPIGDSVVYSSAARRGCRFWSTKIHRQRQWSS
mgnify:CR=1 FL=1